ncbi:hypothetical protein FOA52_013357 [Chlamydomonas sp. UWO 241]|nr:hypothetical protein FOA52_013357 [Chlamydomonas sp. UWO 241]
MAGDGEGAGGGPQSRGGPHSRPHVPLAKRQCEPSVEERAARLGLPWPPVPHVQGDGADGSGADGAVDATALEYSRCRD